MAQLYADENFSHGTIAILRTLGHDILTVMDAGRRGDADDLVLDYASSCGRTVLTFNRRHFRILHLQHPNHAGIVSCTRDDDVAALAARIDAALAGAGNLAGQHLRINRSP